MVMYFMTKHLIIISTQKMESIQYNACLAITGAIGGTNFVAGTENFVPLMNFSKIVIQNTFSIPFL